MMTELVSQQNHSTTGHSFPNVVAHNSYVHQGDVYNNVVLERSQKTSLTVEYGLCLGFAPLIEPSYFVGRTEELNSMHDTLQPQNESIMQRVLVVGGIGGIGKTQLALAYAQRHRTSYTSVFWLNSTSEQTLKDSFRALAGRVLDRSQLDVLSDEQAHASTLAWLADVRNTRWLLIFDNHDEPEQLNIKSHYPFAGHGSILVTTRLPDRVDGQQIRLQPIQNIDESLQILQVRSRRTDVRNDAGARRLAKRLDGLPLALVSAGAYLRRSTISFQQYLETYEQRWHVDPRRQLRLQDYQGKTLYTTWNLSYAQLMADDLQAAQMLKLLAYFDHQQIWYELLASGNQDDLAISLKDSLIDRSHFESAMGMLVDLGLVEVQHEAQCYNLHSIVHDWTLGELNETVDPSLFWYAFTCVSATIKNVGFVNVMRSKHSQVSQHAVRLTHDRFAPTLNFHRVSRALLSDAVRIAELLKEYHHSSAAERLLSQAVTELESTLGNNHVGTLYALGKLADLYILQDRTDEAEPLYLRAQTGFEKEYGPDHHYTRSAAAGLSSIYLSRKEYDKVEKMYEQELSSKERMPGADPMSALLTARKLGELYRDQDKLDKAQQMLERALAGCETALADEPYNSLTLDIMNTLGRVYADQGNAEKAEEIARGALKLFEGLFNTKEYLYMDILSYIITLRRIIQMNSMKSVPLLLRLLDLVKQARFDKYIFSELGHALLSYGDDEVAQEAFHYCLRRIEKDPAYATDDDCLGCLQKLTPNTGLHVCRQCLALDLCTECEAKYRAGDLKLRYSPFFTHSSSHEIVRIDPPAQDMAMYMEENSSARVEEWIDGVIAKYTTESAQTEEI